MFGAYRTTRSFAISRLFIRFVLFGCSSAFLTYLYVWVEWKYTCHSFLKPKLEIPHTFLDLSKFRNVLDERNKANSDSTYFRIYILVLGVYTAVRLTFATLVKIPACHSLSDLSDRWPFFQFFKWIYQVILFTYWIMIYFLTLRIIILTLFFVLLTSGEVFCWAWAVWEDKWFCPVILW